MSTYSSESALPHEYMGTQMQCSDHASRTIILRYLEKEGPNPLRKALASLALMMSYSHWLWKGADMMVPGWRVDLPWYLSVFRVSKNSAEPIKKCSKNIQ